MKIIELRTAIINSIKTEFPDAYVERHPGRFSLGELKRIATKLPAIRVAVLSAPTVSASNTGENEVSVRLAAFVITGDRKQVPKDVSAITIVEGLLTLIPYNNWTQCGVTAAKNVKADNLFSGGVDVSGVAMWAVTWDHEIRVGADAWGGGVMPSELYLNGDKDTFGEEEHYDEVTEHG